MQWVASIRRHTKATCVWVLGHSEGGIVTLMADRYRTELCGRILVSVPGRPPLGQLLREQLQANPTNAPLLDAAFGVITSLEAGQRVDTTTLHPALKPLFHPAVHGFLIDSFSVDPTRLAATARSPMLIVQGSSDLQVSVDDARRLQAAAPQARLVVLPSVNHVLMLVASDDRSENLASYGRTDLAIAPWPPRTTWCVERECASSPTRAFLDAHRRSNPSHRTEPPTLPIRAARAHRHQ